ncbi:MAG TPA: prolipoprotein diacylglyceryl transferase family protein, partial [Verrucomicrobiae bacterium]|nr:prolipoprotein diacylglyceryl transferase family protein [Verrucomicrobiae bacterium]
SLDTLQAAGVYQTGLLLALVTAIFYMRKTGLPVLKTSDVFAPGVAAGHAVGRLGCFSAGCCWGIECHLPWAVTFTNPDAHKLVGVPLGVPLHPTQLYEAFAETLICIFLLLRTRRAHAAGEILGWYLVLYSVARFLIEFFRNHEQATHLGLSLTQWISLGTLALGIWLLRPKSPKLAVSHS